MAIIIKEKIYINKVRINLAHDEYCKFSKITSSGSGASSTDKFFCKKNIFLSLFFIQQQHKKYFIPFIFINIFIQKFDGYRFKKFSCCSIVLKVTKITPAKFSSVRVLVFSNNSFNLFSDSLLSSIKSDKT